MQKNKELNEIELFIQNCENIKDIFHIVNHWKTEQLTNVTKYNGSTFISKRFYDLNIATDIVFMDDTCCVNYFDFPLICITFEDFNGVRQLLAFGFLPSKEEKDFNSFLYDIKNYISKPIRVFIVDRLKSQAKSIKNIFINAEIVYCRVHLERNIRTTFGHYSKIGSLIHQLFNGKITNEIYLNNLDELIDQIKKHKNALIRLREEFNSYCPSYLSQLRLRNNYTTNPQEGFFGNFKQRFGNQRISLSELLNGVVGFYQAAIVNSMKITPKKFKKNICSAPNLGVLAFDKLCDQLKESSHIMNLLKSENNEDIIKGREILNKECKCIIKHEFGLPCYHDIINNATNTLNPIIPIESIPNIYFYSGPSIEEETKIVNIQDDNGEKIDFSFTNLMSMFAKVAVKAPKNKKIQENIVSMFQEIDKSEIDDNPEPLTLKEKGRKPSRPAIRNSGAKKRKRTNQCGYCHGYGHNKATCKLYKLSLQSNEKDEKNDQFNNQIDEENNHFNNGNNDLDENDIQYYSSDSNENQLNDFSNNCNSDNMNYFANDSSDDLINDFNDLKSNSNNLKDYSENEETDLSNDDSIQNIESYLEHLSNNQIKILEKCPSFKKFIIQITQPKNQYDRPTVNGIYYSQYPTILRYASSHLIEGEAAEINAIKLIYLMNFNAEIPNNLIPEILEMVKYFVDDDIGI